MLRDARIRSMVVSVARYVRERAHPPARGNSPDSVFFFFLLGNGIPFLQWYYSVDSVFFLFALCFFFSSSIVVE